MIHHQHAILGGKDHPQQGLVQTILEVEQLLHPSQDAAHSEMRTWSLGLGNGFNKKMELHKNSQVRVPLH